MGFNKGEWTEAYTFIKLLGEGQVFAADENLNKIDEKAYTIFKIFQENIKRYYEIDSKNQKINIVDFEGNLIDSKDSIDFVKKADESLGDIIKGKGRSFEVPILEEFLNDIGIYNLKSAADKKEDIKMEILDLKLDNPKTLNFSVKSFLGEDPTLFNASRDNTNFLFKIEGLSEDEMKSINSIKSRIERIGEIFRQYKNNNYRVEFIDEKDKILYQNLRLIDSSLPKILAVMVFYFFSHKGINSVSDLTDILIQNNPLNLEDSEKGNFYNKKISEFLEAVAFGMVPATKWDGNNEINGGFLSVLKDGEILCHHLYYDNISLKNYLMNHTRFDYPAGSPKKHDYGFIFNENGEFFLKLNLQVRFDSKEL